ncbi:MAG: hypothetical protein AAGG50_07970 [Bacteroidota bacterium]
MRPVVLLALLLPLALAARPPASIDDTWCEDRSDYYGNDYAYGEEVYVQRSLTLPARTKLNVDGGPNGSIRVEGWDRDEILVEACIRARAKSDDAARTRAEAVEIDTAFGIRALFPKRDRRDGETASFRVFVPRGTDLDLETSNGGIRIADIASTIRFNTSNGGVRMINLGGDVRGRTGNGVLVIELDGPSWDGKGLDVRSGNGAVKLYIPDDYSGSFASGTGNGRLNVDFPITVQGRIDRNVEFILGDGGPLLRARTGNGSVHIERS